MRTAALIHQTGLLRGPGIGHGVGYGHHGFGLGHIGTFLIHMAIWHMISRVLFRVPGLLALVVLVGLGVFIGRWWSRRRTNRSGWAPRQW
jgi:hypothetical protein